uniref:tRNA(Ile)-lysidine synthase, chloroplastic n=1 Tax=Galaxaura rugosa TaxID=268570 RepID=A0A1G4NSP3_9FLOR|nr:tRNA Ile-lysidine synthetase [Galaxaura rugosa]SCW21702.1 tRNA Ile-lysidine synthetase [Galaxaura rugosa]
MNTFLHYKLKLNLKQKLQIYNQKILVGISGGQDSLCLLQLLTDLKQQYKLRLGIIYIDHQLRYDTEINNKHIINIAKQYNIPSYIYQLERSDYTENHLRNLRYQVFIKTAYLNNYQLIATAHHIDDQIETCLYHLIRGSSIDGLNSLNWYRYINENIKIIRPILNFKKSEIMWFCRYYNLPIWSDYTNSSYIYTRNRIRQELIPYLQSYFNHNFQKHISNFLDLAYLDTEYLRQNTIKIYLLIKHPKLMAINTTILLKQHLTLQFRILRLFFYHNLKLNIPYSLIKNIIFIINNNTEKAIPYQNIIIIYQTPWIYIT